MIKVKPDMKRVTLDIKTKNFEDLDYVFNGMYNPKSTDFDKALEDGIITKEFYEEAKTYFGDRW